MSQCKRNQVISTHQQTMNRLEIVPKQNLLLFHTQNHPLSQLNLKQRPIPLPKQRGKKREKSCRLWSQGSQETVQSWL